MSNEARKPGYMQSGELARLAGVSTDTLRHYERKGLLPKPYRSMNGYRKYPEGSLDRIRLVRRALSVGFTLDELARVLAVRDRGGAPCQTVRALAQTKLSEVESQLRDLTSLRSELRALLKDWDLLLAEHAPPERAGLLESLASSVSQRKPLTLSRTPLNRKKQSKENQW